MKKILFSTIFSVLAVFSTPKAEAAVFLSAVANPFVFCSLPMPCKKCQPWRGFWKKICPAGQASPQEKQLHQTALNDLAKTDPLMAEKYMTAERFRSELGKASLSAFTEDDQYNKEVQDWIKYQGNQVVNGKQVYEIWCEKQIYNPLMDATLRQAAYNDIVTKNQKIVETISNGYMPPKNTKPWYDYTGTLKQCPNIMYNNN